MRNLFVCTGQDYLSGNGLSFAQQTKPVGRGDVNADGEYSAADLVIIRGHLSASVLMGGDNLGAADLNNDGNVNIKDLIRLKKKFIAG